MDMKTKKKNSRSLMLEILDWLGFRLKLAGNLKLVENRWDPRKKWQLVWKSSGYTVFFVKNYDAPPFRRYESCFSLETKPKKPLGSCFAEFLGDVEAFELEEADEAEVDITSHGNWLKNPLFGCKSLEEAKIKLDLLKDGAS